MNRRNFLKSTTAGGIILAAPSFVSASGIFRGSVDAGLVVNYCSHNKMLDLYQIGLRYGGAILTDTDGRLTLKIAQSYTEYVAQYDIGSTYFSLVNEDQSRSLLKMKASNQRNQERLILQYMSEHGIITAKS